MKPPFPHKTISVAMTTFNGARYLEEQVHSILNQTNPPIEIIISDDCSTDDTVQVIEKLKKQYPVIKYVVNEERLGVINNFKKAVSLTGDSDFIALSDQDDTWMPEKLQKLSERLAVINKADKPCMVYSDMVVIDDHKMIRNTSFWNELGQDGYRHCFETLLFGNFVTGCTILMNRKMREYFSEMPDHVFMHDAWLSLIAYALGTADEIREPLVKYRSHETNLVFSKNAYKKKTRIQRWLDHLKRVFVQNDFLVKQINLVEMFSEQYGHLLTLEQAGQVKIFLQLKNKSYLRKMMVFRRIFKVFWLRPQ